MFVFSTVKYKAGACLGVFSKGTASTAGTNSTCSTAGQLLPYLIVLQSEWEEQLPLKKQRTEGLDCNILDNSKFLHYRDVVQIFLEDHFSHLLQ